MGDRLRSYALHIAARRSGAPAYTLGGNQTLSNADINEAKQRLSKRNRARIDMEGLMEQYPFHVRHGIWNVSRDEIQHFAKLVQYVVRFDHFDDDLRALLNAFGCEEEYLSVNMHVMKKTIEMDDVASRFLKDCLVQLQFHDWRHKLLSARADMVNRDGIDKVVDILPSIHSLSKHR